MREENTEPCPNCGAVVEIDAISVIKPGSEELQDLFKGEVNVVTCNSCDATFCIPAPLLYRDDEKRIIVYYLPATVCEDKAFAATQIDALNSEIMADLPAAVKPSCRLVTEYPHFMEKVALIQGGMDDRIIEYVKYMLLQNSDELNFDEFDLLYDFSAQKEDALVFIAYSRETNAAEYGLEFDKEDYNELVEMFTANDDAAEKLNELFPGHIVSVEAILAIAAEYDDHDHECGDGCSCD